MVGAKLPEVKLVLEKPEDGKLFELVAEGDVDGDEGLAGDSKLDEHFVGDGDGGEVELADVGG
jgi:hypothetical protein